MLFAKVENGNIVMYPIFDGYLSKLFPELPLPITDQSQLPEGYVIVHDDGIPPFDWQYRTHDVPPVLEEDGRWVKRYERVPLSEEEKFYYIEGEKQKVREKRNTLLLLSDWTQLNDAPLSSEKKAEFVVYRQALRDVTTQEGFPLNVLWPQLP